MLRKLLFISLLFFTINSAVTEIDVDGCNGLADDSSNMNTNCVKTAISAGSTVACCMVTFNDEPQFAKAHATLVSELEDAANPASGGKIISNKYYGCFAKGAATHLRLKSGANAIDGGSKDGFILSTTVCGDDGETKAAAIDHGDWWVYSSGSSGTSNLAAITGNKDASGTAANTVSKGWAGTPSACDCGESVMPADTCA